MNNRGCVLSTPLLLFSLLFVSRTRRCTTKKRLVFQEKQQQEPAKCTYRDVHTIVALKQAIHTTAPSKYIRTPSPARPRFLSPSPFPPPPPVSFPLSSSIPLSPHLTGLCQITGWANTLGVLPVTDLRLIGASTPTTPGDGGRGTPLVSPSVVEGVDGMSPDKT